MNKLISIIVPVYKTEAYLRKCIESILAQTHKELDIILVEDGSPDQCGSICDYYASIDSRIRVFHESNGGPSSARNVGLENAIGDYIGFVDSDDWIEPDMFEYLMQGLLASNAQISTCGIIHASDKKYITVNNPYSVLSTEDALRGLLSDNIDNSCCNKLFSRGLWDDLRFPLSKYYEDVLTIYKVFEKAELVVQLPDAKYYFQVRLDSITGRKDYTSMLHKYTAFCERYREASPRLPQFQTELFHRIRLRLVPQLCVSIIYDKEARSLNKELLQMLSGFIRINKGTLYSACNFSWLERKKFDSFARGTVAGCRRSLLYHSLLVHTGYSPYRKH